MKRLGIFIDVSNLYYCCEKQHGRKIDYKKYLDFVRDLGDIKFAIAYVATMGTQSEGFINILKELGIEVYIRTPKSYPVPGGGTKHKCDMDVKIALDMVNRVSQMDLCVLGSADGDLTPAVEWLNGHSVPTVIFATGISSELARNAKTAIEIPPSVLI